MENETQKGPFKCSFCNKSQNEVRHLIAGPKVYICDECVEICNEIIAEQKAMRRVINGKIISLWRGDITTLAVDAIVNAANNHLWMGGGVAGAIKRQGGVSIEREAVAKGPIGIGEAIATGAGRLEAKHVIHAAVMGQELSTDANKIEKATKSALQLANNLGIRSIAFPALGTGVGGFPIGECARIMLHATKLHLETNTSLENVIFALYGNEVFGTFEAAIKALDHEPK